MDDIVTKEDLLTVLDVIHEDHTEPYEMSDPDYTSECFFGRSSGRLGCCMCKEFIPDGCYAAVSIERAWWNSKHPRAVVHYSWCIDCAGKAMGWPKAWYPMYDTYRDKCKSSLCYPWHLTKGVR